MTSVTSVEEYEVRMRHRSVNIAHTEGLYRAATRVLRSEGRPALHDARAAPVPPIHLPVTRARERADGPLRTPDEVHGLRAGFGSGELAWDDQPAVFLDFNRRRAAVAARTATQPPLGVRLLLGPCDGAIVANQAPNGAEDRARIIMAARQKSPAVGSWA